MKKHPDRVDWNYPLIVSADVQILLPAIKVSALAIMYYPQKILFLWPFIFFFQFCSYGAIGCSATARSGIRLLRVRTTELG